MKNKQAFTLIELLVVVLIIGILAAIALPQYQKAVLKSQMMEALSLGQAIIQAQRVYQLANGIFATDLEELDIDLSAADTKYRFVTTSDHVQVVPKKSGYDWFWDFWYETDSGCVAPQEKPFPNAVCASITGVTSPYLANENLLYYKMAIH